MTAAGRLAVVMDDSSNPLETYSYGASNERLVTVQGSTTNYYCWEGGQVIAEYHAGTSSNLVWDKSYVHLSGRLLATTDSGGTKYHHPDRLGTRLVTDTSGNVTTEQANLPFGTALGTESTGTPTNRRFTSYDRSATTGMDYAVNRFYNSAQGRFNQVDPIGMGAVSLSNPQSLNLYGYCENDPINHVDPDGLFLGKLFGWIGNAIKKVAKVFAVVLAVAAVLAFSWGFAAIGIQALIGAGIFAAIGWGSGKLSEFAGAFLGTLGKGGNFRTPPINGSSAIGRYLVASGNGPGDEVINTDFVLVIATSEPYAWWNRIKEAGNKAWDWATTDGLQSLSDISAGLGDTISFGLTRKFRQWQGYDDAVNTDSGSYTVGEYTGYLWDVASGGGLTKAGVKAAGYGGKLAVHTAHHYFPRFGRQLPHLQLNVWKVGVKGQGNTTWFRIPLPQKYAPPRDRTIFKF